MRKVRKRGAKLYENFSVEQLKDIKKELKDSEYLQETLIHYEINIKNSKKRITYSIQIQMISGIQKYIDDVTKLDYNI